MNPHSFGGEDIVTDGEDIVIDLQSQHFDTSVLYGARACFAIHVMLGHYFAFLTDTKFDLLGSSSVSLFFILSGFVMTVGYGNRESINKSKFYFKRFARLMPVFYVMFAMYTIVRMALMRDNQSATMAIISITARFFLVDVWLTTLIEFFGEAWALSVMVGFYIFFPYIVSRFHDREAPTHSTIGRFVKLSFFAFIMAFLWAIAYGIVIQEPILIYFAYRMFLPARLLHFCMGIIAGSMFMHKEQPICSADVTTTLLASVIIVSLITSLFIPWFGILVRTLGEFWLTPFQAIWLHALAMQPDSYTATIFQWRIFHVLGNWSYTCYMCHMFVFGSYLYITGQLGVHDTVLSEDFPWTVYMEWYHFPFIMVCVTVMSWMLYRFVEVPCRSYLVDRFIGK